MVNNFICKSQKGFTLVEIMVAMAISFIILAGVYVSLNSQHKSYVVQDDIVEMQQNIRGAILTMTNDIRETGCDPLEKSVAGPETALPGIFSFTRDINDAANSFEPDGDVNDNEEAITYGLLPSEDTDSDGIPDSGGVSSLGRISGAGSFQTLVENVEFVEFNYILDDGTSASSVPVHNLAQIRSVQISLLLRSSKTDPQYSDTKSYTAASGTVFGPYNDNYRRRLGSTSVYCNNMGY